MKCRLLAAFLLGGLATLCPADPIPVRYPQGTSHGFLLLRTQEGKTIALGDSTSSSSHGVITGRLVFHFKDGSVDDDHVTYTQNGTFHLLHEHHVQKGPTFPKAVDIEIDAKSGMVTTHEQDKDGSDKVKTQHVDFPPDLANGIMVAAMENLRPTAASTKLSLVVPFGGARLIHLVITPVGEVPFRVGGTTRKAEDFLVKVELGGVVGAVAPVIGKQPKDVHFYIYESNAPAFVEETGQLYEDGPIWRIEQVGPEVLGAGTGAAPVASKRK